MNGSQHYEEAERLVSKSNEVDIDDGYAQLIATQALVHATLAQSAAQAMSVAHWFVGDSIEITRWARAIGALPAQHDEQED